MKGMLTGPVTILCWSFVRVDLNPCGCLPQIALALRDEVMDWKKPAPTSFKLTNPALREGLPLKRGDAAAYLRWAVTLSVWGRPASPIQHRLTNICAYSEFNASSNRCRNGRGCDQHRIEPEQDGAARRLRNFPISQMKSVPGVYDITARAFLSIEEIVILLHKGNGTQ